MIEVWEKLDCESVGRKEIVAIEAAVRERFGPSAVDSPMVIARLLADEGAELRHPEIMELYIERVDERPFDNVLSELFDLTDFSTLRSSLAKAEDVRKKLLRQNDNPHLRELRSRAIEIKRDAIERSKSQRTSRASREFLKEAASWITLWLQSPELFENWVKLRIASAEFRNKFPIE